MESQTVNIFTLSKYKEKCTIFANDLWFDKVRTDRVFLNKHEELIYAVDMAKIVDYKNLTVVTTYGTTDITKLSTGCKTLLNILYLLEKGDDKPALVNITEAGDAVVDRILEIVAGTNVSVYLRRSFCPSNMRLSYKINGVAISDEFEFIKAIDLE